MNQYILSIDQGTTSSRAIVFDKFGKALGIGQKEFKQIFPQAGWVEHDALEILAVQIQCIKEAIKNASIAPSQIACVGVTNQRETNSLFGIEKQANRFITQLSGNADARKRRWRH